jgi:hypothetical protein
VFTITFTCTELAAMIAGPIIRRIVFTPSSRHWKSGRKRKPTLRNDGSCTPSCSAPPTSVPSARPKSAFCPKVGSNSQPSVTPPTIEPMLKNDDAIAGTPKTLREFSMPMTSAPSETRRMNGIHRARELHGEFGLAGHLIEAWREHADEERRDEDPDAHERAHEHGRERAPLVRELPCDCSPSFWIFLEKVVTNAVESAPSAKRSRSRFGVRKATMKASISLPPPKSHAKTCSRMSPRPGCTSPLRRRLRRLSCLPYCQARVDLAWPQAQRWRAD